MKKLSPRQEAFCMFYAASGNAEQSCLKAGYSRKYARSDSSNLLARPYIQNRLKELTKEIVADRIATVEEVKTFWTDTLRNEALDLNARIKVAELLAKTGGAFTEKVDLNVSTNTGLLKEILDEIKS